MEPPMDRVRDMSYQEMLAEKYNDSESQDDSRDDSLEGLLPHDTQKETVTRMERGMSTNRKYLYTILFVMLLLVNNTVFIWYGKTHPTATACGLSPLGSFKKGRLDRGLHLTYGNSFEPWNAYTLTTKQSGDYVEARWAELGIYPLVRAVPVHMGAQYGLDPKRHVVLTREQNSYIEHDSFLVSVRVTHDLHCLDMLRQGLWFNHEYYVQRNHVTWIHAQDNVTVAHVGHCIDQLRQTLMCHADDDFLPWRIDTGGDVADFAMPRLCRNFESVRQFSLDPRWAPQADFNRRVDDANSFWGSELLATNWTAQQMWRGL